MNTQSLKGKSILMIIARENFRDEEYAEPHGCFKDAGADVTVASSRAGECKSTYGKVRAEAEISIEEVQTEKYDAVVFVGGAGSSEFFDKPTAHSIASAAFKAGKIVAAICIAPMTLANAGLLKGRKATSYPSVADDMTALGTQHTGADVEQDGRIITANGPGAAAKFAETIQAELTADHE